LKAFSAPRYQWSEDTEDTAFKRMYAECFDAIQRFCYFKLPGKTDGDDVIQEVALAAWSKRESVRSEGSFKPWLMQIAANKIRDFYRRRAKQFDVPLDETCELSLAHSRRGITVEETVKETFDALGDVDRQILTLYYLRNVPQAEIAQRLGVPPGTVKSRLHTARRRFKTACPHLPKKGENEMSKLPKVLPEYVITKTDKPPFNCKWEELQGWFLVPRLGEKVSWAMYDMPERGITGECGLKVTGRAVVHGVEGVEITAEQDDHGRPEPARKFVAQLTDTHVRFLAESHMRGDVKHFFTFIDGEAFLDNWGFGEDNRGNDIHPKHKRIIKQDGSVITCPAEKFVLDVVDRCMVTLSGKEYDTIRVMDIECYNSGMVSEQFLDKNGHTVLWRRFNRDDWHFNYYKQKWSDKLPHNERLVVNGETYIHWYDCVTDYVM
jgi:RNA polymerase sigma factor (sigma-70 family)